MDISFLDWLPLIGIFSGAAALGDVFGLGAGLFGADALAAGGADVLGAGAADVLGAGAVDLGGAAAADVAGGAAAADLAGGTAAADLAGGAAAADLAGVGGGAAAADLAAGGLGAGIDAAGFAAPAAADAAGVAAETVPAAANLGAVAPALAAPAQAVGGVLPASAALPLPGSALDLTQVSDAGLSSLTGTGPGATLTDIPTTYTPYAGLDPATNLANAANTLPASTGGGAGTADLGVDLTGASDSSAIGVGGGPSDVATGNVPPTPGASQADISGGMLGSGASNAPSMQAAGTPGTTPGVQGAGAAKTAAGAGAAGAGGGFDMWKAAGLGLAAAPLAITLMRGQQDMPQQGQQSQALATQVGSAGSQLLNQAMQGQVTPGQQAQLTLDRQRMVNQARQQLYNQGIQNPETSAAWGGMMANIDNQMAVEMQQFLTANINEAFTGTGQAQGNLTNLAQQQISLDNAYTQAIANAGRSLGSVVGQAGTRLL